MIRTITQCNEQIAKLKQLVEIHENFDKSPTVKFEHVQLFQEIVRNQFAIWAQEVINFQVVQLDAYSDAKGLQTAAKAETLLAALKSQANYGIAAYLSDVTEVGTRNNQSE